MKNTITWVLRMRLIYIAAVAGLLLGANSLKVKEETVDQQEVSKLPALKVD